MELDDLKDLWKKNVKEFRTVDETEIASMLKRQSKSIVDKLKRNVWFELIVTVVASILLLIYALTLKNGALKWISISILLLFAGYLFYYIKKINLLNRFNPTHENLKANLEKLIESVSGYLIFYKRSYAILYPVYFFLALLFTAIERGTDKFLHMLNQPTVIFYLLVLAIFFFFCSTWLTRWYLNKLYGNHLEKLKKLLTELQS